MQNNILHMLFPEKLLEIIAAMDLDERKLQEIRIRAGQPLLAVCDGKEYWSKEILQISQVKQILSYMSGYSMYAYEDEVRQGFLTLPGGHRVGLAGRVVLGGRTIRTMTEISSLNIRFAHEIRGCADVIYPWLWNEGRLLHTLIVSAPGHGKTTILRDCIRQISNGRDGHAGMTVGVVDERSEIAGCYRGIAGNDLGMRTDVLDGCPKAEGMMMLIRSMAPRVVAVDEIGSKADLEALMHVVNCGCVILATVHGEDWQDLMNKPVLREMIRSGIFERYIFLRKDVHPGRIREILDQNGRNLC